MEQYFVWDGDHDPVRITDSEAWQDRMSRTNRLVAKTSVTPQICVLTEFSGFDDVLSDRPARLFRTYVFGGWLDGEVVTYVSQQDALAGHTWMIGWCLQAPPKGTEKPAQC